MMSISERVSEDVNKCQGTGVSGWSWIAVYQTCLLNPNPFSSLIKSIEVQPLALVKLVIYK